MVALFSGRNGNMMFCCKDGADADLLAVLLAVAVDTCSRRVPQFIDLGDEREYTTAELQVRHNFQTDHVTISNMCYIPGQTTPGSTISVLTFDQSV